MGLTELRGQLQQLCNEGVHIHRQSSSQCAEFEQVFLRVILDNAVGGDTPCCAGVGNMSESQLRSAIDLAREVNDSKKDFDVLNQNSLALRAERDEEEARHSAKRRRIHEKAGHSAHSPTGKRPKTTTHNTGSLRGIFNADAPPRSNQARPEAETARLVSILARIDADLKLSPFRKRVLSLLTQVPRGRHTTYKALADAVARTAPSIQHDARSVSCARAVGSAMRNNPFAPTVPCHRVLAADGKIGGFNGDWGEDGRYAQEKLKLLRDEGVRFDGRGRVVGRPFTGFV